MLTGSGALVVALVYGCLLFALAWWGDGKGRGLVEGRWRRPIYVLSLGVYCTSWTFYGSVGLASHQGLDFLPIYIGPILVFALGAPMLRRIAEIARAQNLTTVADFVAARYGKSPAVAALAALIAVVASAPYIALQLKAIVQSMRLVAGAFDGLAPVPGAPWQTASLLVAPLLAGFAIAFGTRRVDATEHQGGLMLAIAGESLGKLVAFLAVGLFVVTSFPGGIGALAGKAMTDPVIHAAVGVAPDPGYWIVVTMLAAFAVIALPRQFHVGIVENRDSRDIGAASWGFPLYLVLINVFVLPIAVAGMATLSDTGLDRDMTVLALPLQAGARGIALLAMLGGLTAATGMVIVDSVALAVTIGNDLVLPLALRGRDGPRVSGAFVLGVRRAAIVVVLALGYLYARAASDAALSSYGLLSFAAIAQIAPAMIGGLLWRRGTARGAAAGLAAGLVAWAYLLLLPSLTFETVSGPGMFPWFSPQAILAGATSPIVAGALWSLGVNALCFVAFSLTRSATPLERSQAEVFSGRDPSAKALSLFPWRAAVSAAELEGVVARFLGRERAGAAFRDFAWERGAESAATAADAPLVRHAEHLLSSAIGASASRFALAMLFGRHGVDQATALKMFDDAAEAIQSSRDQLQQALDHARQGITVFDANLGLRNWNRAFVELFAIPPNVLAPGFGLEALIRFNARRGAYGPDIDEDFVAERLDHLLNDGAALRQRLHPSQRVVETRSARLPDGGIITTYADVSETVAAEEELSRVNERLEKRVRERTAALERLNRELASAKTSAEEANASKTRFLAAAGHDILQPLNAARLYASSLSESLAGSGESAELARNVDSSLEAVEEILGALLDMSRLDAGAIRPIMVDVSLADLFRRLNVEFGPAARAKGLRLTFVASSLAVRSDRRMFRRALQNLVSNAIKYTPKGRVLVGARRVGGRVRVEVRDTGLGIPASRQRAVFEEFHRLDEGARAAKGLGLGLSIVERIGRVLGLGVGLSSEPGKGSVFSLDAPRGQAVVESAASPGEAPGGARRLEPLEGLRVLAIDNEPRVLDGMRTLLTRWGCKAAVAAGLADATARLADLGGAPDVIIADYHLDEGDGLFAIAALRAMLGVEVAAILATADRSQELRDAAERANVHLLNKPLKPAPLRALLMRALQTKPFA